MSNLLQDLRYAVRMMLRQPAFTAVAVIALAIGIGANTAIFTVVNGVLLRPLPYDDPDRIVCLWDTQPQLATAPASLPDFIDWKEQNQSFEYVAAYLHGSMFLDTGEGSQTTRVGLVTPDLFSLFRVSPILGRTFTDEESQPGRTRVAILSESMWHGRFGSDPNVLGQTLQLSGADYTIIGVLPAGFGFPDRAEVWRPLAIDPKQLDRGPHYLRVIGRLKTAVPLSQAQAEMSTIAAQLAQQYPEKIAGHGVKLELLTDVVIGDIKPALLVLFAAVAFLLLIACANVANLLLARAGARQREIALRTALGASRLRIVRQLLTESVLLAFVGGAGGLLVAIWGVDSLLSLSPDTIPRATEISIDPQVACFTLLISVATGVLFGLAPALQVSRPDLTDALKESGRTTAGVQRNRLRSLLVVSEIALSLVLLLGAGLMIRSFARLNEIDPGFNPNKVLTMGVTLLRNKYPEDEQVAAFYSELLNHLASAPGVMAAGAISELPLAGNNTNDYFTIEGRPAVPKEERPLTEYRVVTPGYFESMGIPLLAGRDFSSADTKRSPNVAVINEAFARRHFNNEDPLGHRISLQGENRGPSVIVGVVGNVRDFGLDEKPTPETFVPLLQDPLSSTYQRSMTIVARTSSEPAAIAESLRAEVTSIDKSLPVSKLKPMDEYLRNSLSRRRFNMVLLSVFSAIALLLAVVGIYGVISYSVTQRTHEIGVRMAVGAQSRDILRLVVGQSLVLTVMGVAVGIGAALALTRLMESLLFEVSATDPLTFAAISVVLTAASLAASFIPARRATQVDPMTALRHE